MISIKPSLLWKEFALFSTTQFLGIWSAFKFFPFIKGTTTPIGLDFSIIEVIYLVIFVVAFLFLLKYFSKGANIFLRIFLITTVIAGAQIVFFSFLPENPSTLLAVILGIAFVFIKRVFIQNIAMIFGIAGIGAIFSLSITPITAVIILLVLSFYDIIAVYWTKHMVKMAEGMIKTKNIFGLVIPEKAEGFMSSMERAEPGNGFMILGSGDLVMPILLSASLVSISLMSAFIVGLFSIGGMFLTHLLFVNQKIRRPMAALPPIAAMAIIGYVVTTIFNL